MQALGFVETRGLVAAIESADAMLKAADVQLVEKTLVRGGIVTITVTGDVAACRASVDAAEAAVKRMGGTILSTHIIPRPHDSLEGLIVGSVRTIAEPEEEPEKEPEENLEEDLSDAVTDEKMISPSETPEINREYVEQLINLNGIDRTFTRLKRCRAGDIKELVNNEYVELDLEKEEIVNLTKKILLDKLKNYYKELYA